MLVKVTPLRLIESNQQNNPSVCWCSYRGVKERGDPRGTQLLYLPSDMSCVNYQEVIGNSIWLNIYLVTKVAAGKIHGNTLW